MAVVLLAVVAGGIVPRPLPINAITPQARAEIEELLRLHRFGVEKRDRFWIDYPVDQDRQRLARCMRDRADDEGRLAQLGPFAVESLEPYLATYARGMVRERDGLRRYYFRRVPKTRVSSPIISHTTWRWYISEPLESEVGRMSDDLRTSCP